MAPTVRPAPAAPQLATTALARPPSPPPAAALAKPLAKAFQGDSFALKPRAPVALSAGGSGSGSVEGLPTFRANGSGLQALQSANLAPAAPAAETAAPAETAETAPVDAPRGADGDVAVDQEDAEADREELRAEGQAQANEARGEDLAETGEMDADLATQEAGETITQETTEDGSVIVTETGPDGERSKETQPDGTVIYRQSIDSDGDGNYDETVIRVTPSETQGAPPDVLRAEERYDPATGLWTRETINVEGHDGNDLSFYAESYETTEPLPEDGLEYYLEEHEGVETGQQMDVGPWDLPREGTANHTVVSYEAHGNDVEGTAISETFENGMLSQRQQSSMSYGIAQGSDLPDGDLPGDIQGAFSDGDVVVASQRQTSFNAETGENIDVTTQTFSQGNVRATRMDSSETGPTILLERETEEGKAKVSQFFLPGTGITAITHTNVDDQGAVHEHQDVYEYEKDDEWGDEPKLLASSDATRTYDAEGHLATQHVVSTDLQTGTGQTQDYTRTVENGVVTETTTATDETVDAAGQRTPAASAKVEVKSNAADGTPISTDITTSDGHSFHIEEDQATHVRTVTHTYPDPNDPTKTITLTGTLQPGQEPGTAEMVVTNPDGTTQTFVVDENGFRNPESLGALSNEQFSMMGFLVSAGKMGRGIYGIVTNATQDVAKFEAKIAEDFAKAGFKDRMKSTQSLGAMMGIITTAYQIYEDIQNREWVELGMHATTEAANVARFAGMALGKFSAVDLTAKRLGAVGGVLGMAEAVMHLYQAIESGDPYARDVAIADFFQGAALVRLAFVGSGVGAALMFASIAALEGFKIWRRSEEMKHVAPVDPELLAA